jgi:hypothetical protein
MLGKNLFDPDHLSIAITRSIPHQNYHLLDAPSDLPGLPARPAIIGQWIPASAATIG